MWIDAAWLRLAALAVDLDDPTAAAAVDRLGVCWSRDRLRRLRPLLLPEPDR